MAQYINAFRCARNNSGNEIVIKFLQEEPLITPEGTITELKTELISSLVMQPDFVDSLIKALIELRNSGGDN